MPLYTYIIFDVDGTLINTEKAILHSLQKTVKEETGRELSLDELAFAFGIPGHEALRVLEVPDINRAMKKWVAHMYDWADQIEMFPGIPETLEQLKKSGMKLGIVTSLARKDLLDILDHFHLTGLFDGIITASDTEKHKPDPEPLLAFLRQAGIAATEALYVGDTLYDQQCAEGAAVDFALAGWGAKHPDAIDAKRKLQRPGEILALCHEGSEPSSARGTSPS